MANTRKSAKRARQSDKKKERNLKVRSATKTALRGALEALKTKDAAKAKDAYKAAVRSLSKAASKGAVPKGRAARKISRLTNFIKKVLPAAVDTRK